MRDTSPAHFALRNIGWLLASVFLALMIWVAATMDSNPVERRELKNLPVTVELPDGFVLVRTPEPDRVDAVVQSDQSEWELLQSGDVLISADLSQITEPGSYRVELDAGIAPPLHGKVVAIRPGTLLFALDKEAEKRIPVRVIVSNEPPLGYTYPSDLSNACNVTEVTVRGSTERVDSVDHVEVRMNLSDERNPITDRTFPLIAVQTNGNTVRNITLSPDNVVCSVDIQPREDVFQMPVLPRVTGDPPPGYNFEGYSLVDPDTVGLTGNRRAIRELGGLVRTTPIDLTNQTATFTVEVPLDLPDGVSLVPENQLVTVTVTISSQITTRQFEDVPVEITGMDPTLFHATGLANTVTVFVSAPPDQMPDFEHLRVVVDLTGLPPGNHQVAPQGMIIGATDTTSVTISVQPDTLSVTVEALNPTPTPSPTPSEPVRAELTVTPSITPTQAATPVATVGPKQ